MTNGELTENGAVIDLAQRLATLEDVEVIGPRGDGMAGTPARRVLVIPDGKKVTSLKPFLDEYAERPDRKKGTAEILSLASLIEHANTFKGASTVVFVDDNPEKPSVTVVYDYNEAGPDGRPCFGQHRARYEFPVSEEWKAWVQGAGRELDQGAFAEHLEDHLLDLVPIEDHGDTARDMADRLGVRLASPADLLELSKGLTLTVGRRVKQRVNMASGEAEIAFEEEHTDEAGERVKIPGAFVVGLPVFRHGERYQLPVRLRYRARAGAAVSWMFVPHREEVVYEHAMKEAAAKVAEDTQLPLFWGRPEK